MRQLSLLFSVLALVAQLSAQKTTNFWTPVAPDNIALPEGAYREFEPYAYQAFQLDYNAFTDYLGQAPMENTAAAKQNPLRVSIPMADGHLELFALVESPVMMPGLQARYPQMRTFSGFSLQTPGIRIRCSTMPYWGFNAIVLMPDKGVEYIQQLARAQTAYYMVYDRKNYPDELRLKVPTAPAERPADETVRASLPEPRPADRGTELSPVVLKEYRFAVTTTVLFGIDNGGNLQDVLGKVVATTNLLNAIYERDLDIRLKLVDDEDKLIFYDPANDPWTGSTNGGWLSQNPTVIATRLGGADKYDIGHVFARYIAPDPAAGVGSLGSCCTQLKGRGSSSGSKPYGDDFFSIISQEIGHQWNGGHTWAHCEAAMNSGYNAGSACEPGGGTTIMSYAAVCGQVDNVINTRGDLYYNVCSIIEIRRFVELEAGSTCGTNVPTTNNAPVVTIPYPNNFFIPISTPFTLTGSAVDPDGDPLTYCWEGIDVGPLVPMGSPVGGTAIFRSYPPTNVPTRTFPRIQTVISNQPYVAELLPTYSRDLNFALTARDNKSDGGGVGIDTVRFKATDLAGPFLVTFPNGSQAVWNRGAQYVVTWDVANTNKAPVNCQKVNIRLSTDGGLTYPTLLAANVANKGRYCVTAPELTASNARVRVEAADNVFFDISNSNFKIQAPTTPEFTFCSADLFDTICLPASYSTVISTRSLVNFNDPITLSVEGLPVGSTALITPNPVQPGSDAVLAITLPANQPEGTLDYTITGTSGALTNTLTHTLSLYYNDFTGFSLAGPADGAVGQDQAPVLQWNTVTNANTYEIEVASSPSFAAGTILASAANITANSYKVPVLLEKGKAFYWRVRPKNECGTGDWAGPFVFATLVDVCGNFESSDVPKNIPGNAVNTVEVKLNVPAGGKISDLNITQIQGDHQFFKDIEMHLISPSNTDVLLFKDKCPNYNGSFNFGFDDSKAALFGCPPPKDATSYKPTGLLSDFNGQDAGGQWLLRIKDNQIGSGGSIGAFKLELCSSTVLNPPVLVNNNVMSIDPGTNKAVTPDLLKTTDANNTDDELVYTLVTIPQHGELQVNGSGKMTPGGQFTQSQLNNSGLRYFDYATHAISDEFCFTVTDGEGGLIKDWFVIQPVVGAHEPGRSLGFLLAPNPATETVRIAFSEPLSSDTRIRIFDMAGRMLLNQVLASGQIATVLNIANLPEGLYSVTVDNASGSGVRKVVVR